MRVISLAGALVLAAATAGAQQSDGAAVLGRIRAVVRHHLASLPNYTCVETLERQLRSPHAKTFAPLDRVRFEVALVDGREFFAWPGSPAFEERSLSELIGPPNEIGDFAMHTRAIYTTREPDFRYLGRELLAGRMMEKFHFDVPRARSAFAVGVASRRGEVGYEGEIWNDARTLEIRRIEIRVTDVPPGIGVTTVEKRLDFAPVQLSGAARTLPARSQTRMADAAGGEVLMNTVFSGCRQYTGESTLIFDEPAADAAPGAPSAEIALPHGVDLKLKLVDTLDARTVARGDLSVWELTRDAASAGNVLLKRGARVELRVERFSCTDSPLSFCLVGFTPVRVTASGRSGALSAELMQPDLQTTIDLNFRGSSRLLREALVLLAGPRPSPNKLVVRDRHGQLRAGFQTIWRTVRPK